MNLKQTKMKNMVYAGLFAILLSGCASESAASNETQSSQTAATSGHVVQSVNAESDITRKTEVLTAETNGNSTFVEDNVSEGNSAEEKELIEAASKDIQYYFDLTVDLSQSDAGVSYFEKYEDLEARYHVSFSVPENMKVLSDDNNIGSDGYPTEAASQKLKPEYYVSYNENKELETLSVLYMTWEESKVPISIGECKKIAEDFLESKKMIVNGEIKFMYSSIISDSRVYLVYENGENGAIGIGVNTYASKIEDFDYMSKERAEIISNPTKEGSGVG